MLGLGSPACIAAGPSDAILPFSNLVRVSCDHGEPHIHAWADKLCAALQASLQAGPQRSVYTRYQQKTIGLQSSKGMTCAHHGPRYLSPCR